jgi:ribosomal protein S18 acetylase RimI-like enzyme
MMGRADPVVRGPLSGQGSACETVMRSLPAWFGIEQAIVDYATAVNELPTFVAEGGGAVIGFLAVKQTSTCAAEVHVMAVRREAQRRGLGRALLSAAEAHLRESGTEIMHVKTLSDSVDSPPYAETRAFYLAMDFKPLEEIPQIWGDDNPCLIMVKVLPLPG